MFFGSIPALVTPFSGGRVAEDTFRELVEWQIAEGSSALVPCGTTGESRDLTARSTRASSRLHRAGEGARAGHRRLRQQRPRASMEHVQRRQGCGRRRGAGRRALLQPAEPGRAAAHSRPSAERLDLPIIVYNVPARTVTDISVETLGELAKLPNDRRRSRMRPAISARVTAQRIACGEDFCQLSGNDDMALGFNAMGGVGCISVTANVAPQALLGLPEGDARGPLG